MKIHSVYDAEFSEYGQVLTGYDTAALTREMAAIPLPAQGVAYEPAVEALEALPVFSELRARAFGGMPIQLGLCWGHNTRLNCLEYHRDSEINVGTHSFILLLARRWDIRGGTLDTGCVRAFRVPAGVPVEIYATSLHYAPCQTDARDGFRVAIVLPRHTNTPLHSPAPVSEEDRWLWARNKWLLAHPDSSEASQGACAALRGKNIDIAAD